MKPLNILFVLLAYESLSLKFDGETLNKTTSILKRDKRFLVFVPNGGVIKFVTGYLGPIDIPTWQNINCMRNMQFQYDLPQKWVTNPPSFPGLNGRASKGRGFSESTDTIYKSDNTRKLAYEVVEEILRKEGKNGRECILRTICEVAETPVNHNGLVGELLQLFFTPGKHEKLQEEYHHARMAGLHHVNCEKLYPNCPFGHGVLDSISIIKNFKFNNWLNF